MVGECFFWYRLTRVVPDKRPQNGCCCCCVTLLIISRFQQYESNSPEILKFSLGVIFLVGNLQPCFTKPSIPSGMVNWITALSGCFNCNKQLGWVWRMACFTRWNYWLGPRASRQSALPSHEPRTLLSLLLLSLSLLSSLLQIQQLWYERTGKTTVH